MVGKEADEADAKAKTTADYEAAQALYDDARRLRGEADGIAGNWGSGGTYRQITTALVAAAKYVANPTATSKLLGIK